MPKRSFKLSFRFHTKIFLFIGAMVCLSVLSCLFIVQKATEKRVQADFQERFQSSRVAFRHLQDLRKRLTVDVIENLTENNAQFRSILSTVSIGTNDLGLGAVKSDQTLFKDAHLRLDSLLPFLSIYHEYDLFIVTNTDGVLLFTKSTPSRFGDGLDQLPLFEQFEKKDHAEDIWFSGSSVEIDLLLPRQPDNAVYHISAIPVLFKDDFHGVVICGKRIDKNALLQIKDIASTELALFSAQGVQATTLPPKMVQPLNVLLKSDPFEKMDTVKEVKLGEETFLAMLFGILPGQKNDGNGFIVLKSYTEAIQLFSGIRNTFLLVGTIIVLAALAFSFLLARGITKPVKKLARAAKKIGKGDLETRIDIQSGDEIEHLGHAFNEMVEGLKDRDFIKQTFERYVSPKVANEIIKNPDLMHLGGQKKRVTIFFTDIGDFTSLSEKLLPQEVVSHLNDYFEGMSRAILNFDGTINQFQGDAILAFWGAPLDQPDHALKACRAALGCLKFLRKLEAAWVSEGLPPRTYRFGINTGEALVGNIGSSSRFEYTLIGDEVNLASRMEAANKFYGTQTLITEQTYTLVKEDLIARELDLIRVVGRSTPVRVYELIDDKANIDPPMADMLACFQKGLESYRQREWKTAISWFEQVLVIEPRDPPANVYIKRCDAYRKKAPPQDWKGITDLKAK